MRLCQSLDLPCTAHPVDRRVQPQRHRMRGCDRGATGAAFHRARCPGTMPTDPSLPRTPTHCAPDAGRERVRGPRGAARFGYAPAPKAAVPARRSAGTAKQAPARADRETAKVALFMPRRSRSHDRLAIPCGRFSQPAADLYLALLLAGIGALTGLAWWLRTPPPATAEQLRRALVVLAVLLLVFLAATGRLHWLLALAGPWSPPPCGFCRYFIMRRSSSACGGRSAPDPPALNPRLAVARPAPSARRLNPGLSAYGSTMPRGRSTVRCWRALSRAIA